MSEDKNALIYLADMRIDQLEAENAKLRDEFRKMDEWHSKELIAAMDENAKLRELVRGLNYCSDELNSAECERCPLDDLADPDLEPKCVRMMDEMGIEVMG